MLLFSTQRISTAILLLASPSVAYNSGDMTSVVLAKTVPDCALECATQVIDVGYPASECPRRSDFDCFCKADRKDGYTLGESFMLCMLSLCSNDAVSASGSRVYSICDGVPGTPPKTYTRLTATHIADLDVSTSSSPTSTPSPRLASPTASTTSLATFRAPVSATKTEPVVSATSETESVASSTSKAEPVASTTSSDGTQSPSSTPPAGGGGSSSLSTGSVVGVSVMSGLSGSFLVGVVVFLFYRKKRRRQEETTHEPHYFEIGGAMSEPPDFGTKPRRPPTPGPSLPPKSPMRGPDTETSRLMSPFESKALPPNPAVIVTKANDDDYGGDGQRMERPGRIGHAISDLEDSPQPFFTSQRPVSELLPHLPEHGLYPEPLRWAHRKDSIPNSEITTFEEDVSRPRSPSNRYQNFSGLIGPRPYHRSPMPGLPANPRVMLQGFGPRSLRTKQSRRNFRRPAEPRSRSPEAATSGDQTHSQSSDTDDCNDDHCQDSDTSEHRGVGQRSSRGSTRFYGPTINHLPPRENNTGFENIDIQGRGPESHQASRHSGFIKPLSPVREVISPAHDIPNNNNLNTILDRIGYSNGSPKPPVRYPRIPIASTPNTPDSAREIVSRPRIVRQHDIKRVEIRRGKPQQPIVPYSPDDYWLDKISHGSGSLDGSNASNTSTSATQMSSARLSGSVFGSGFGQPVEKTITRKPAAKPAGHNFTPSRRGGDLILRVN